jgi:hypothetical protein
MHSRYPGHECGGVVNMLFDRAFIQFLLPKDFYPGRTSKQAIGIYVQCYKLSIFMNLAIQAFKYAAEPFFFSKGEDKNAPEVFAKVTKYFTIICVVMWVGICLNLDLFAELFLKQKIYHEGLSVVPWLLAGYMFLGIYYNLATWFKLTDKTQYGTWLTLTGALITIVSSFLLVPQIGYLGFAIAFALSGLQCFALLLFWPKVLSGPLRRYFRTRIHWCRYTPDLCLNAHSKSMIYDFCTGPHGRIRSLFRLCVFDRRKNIPLFGAEKAKQAIRLHFTQQFIGEQKLFQFGNNCLGDLRIHALPKFASLVKEHDILPDLHHRVHIMRNDDSGDLILFRYLLDQFVNFDGSQRIEARIGFVAKEVHWVHHDGAGDPYPFFHPATNFRRHSFGRRFQPYALQTKSHPLLLFLHSLVGEHVQGKTNILFNGFGIENAPP